MEVYINGRKIRLSPKKAIGKGGEADVYDIGKGKAVKVFKQPSHPDYSGLPFEQQAASDRLKEHQIKLKHFPANLPAQVVAPQELATDKSGSQIVGYTMSLLKGTTPLLKYGDRNFRRKSNFSPVNIYIHKN